MKIANIISHYAPWFLSEERDVRKVVRRIEHNFNIHLQYKELKISSWQNKSSLPESSEKEWLVLIDDLKQKHWGKNIHKLMGSLFVPLFYRRQPVIILSPFFTKHSGERPIEPQTIHESWTVSAVPLAFEQLSFLIRAKGIRVKNAFPFYYDWINELLEKCYKQKFTDFIRTENSRPFIAIKLPDQKKWFTVSNHLLDNQTNSNPYTFSDYYNDGAVFESVRKPLNVDIRSSLDNYQYEAVKGDNGPVQVLAPAGSGKTRTLIFRIIYLIQKGISPTRILALAFNRKAMIEMRQRLAKLGIHQVKVYTLHAYGLKIIKHFLKDWDFTEEEDKSRNIRNMLVNCLQKDYPFRMQRDQDVLSDFINALERVKSTLCHPSEIKLSLDDTPVDFVRVFNNVLKLQNRLKLFEFSDMIYLAVRLLFRNPEFRSWLQMQQQYVLVDEFQDLNAAQIMMVDILSRPWRNLFVVGDDDQLIYGWRGAETEHILDFEKRFGCFKQYILNYNYRSKRSLVLLSRQIIMYNKNRVDKRILPKNFQMDESLKILPGKGLWEEAQTVVNTVHKLLESGSSPGDIALLSRFNASLFILSLLMEKKGIPHEVPDPSQLLQTIAGRDFLAYLTLAAAPDQARAWMVHRVLKRPNKYFTNEFIQKIKRLDDLPVKGKSRLKVWQWERILDFLDHFSYLNHLKKGGMSARGFVAEMIRVFDLKSLYEQGSQELQLDRSGELAVLEILQLMSKPFQKPEDYLNYLQSLEKTKTSNEKTASAVHLTTIHRTKGNEYPIVFIFHLNDPPDKDEQAYPLDEEERRVSYVAATRAIERLYISVTIQENITHLKELLKPFFLISQKKLNLKSIRKEEKKKLREQVKNLPENNLHNEFIKIVHEMDGTITHDNMVSMYHQLQALSEKADIKGYKLLVELLDRQFLLNTYDMFLKIKR